MDAQQVFKQLLISYNDFCVEKEKIHFHFEVNVQFDIEKKDLLR